MSTIKGPEACDLLPSIFTSTDSGMEFCAAQHVVWDRDHCRALHSGNVALSSFLPLLREGLTEQTGMSRSTMAPLGWEQQQGGSELQEIRVCSKSGTWHRVDGMG